MATIKDIINFIESWAPLSLQGDFDNCGLKTGETDVTVTGVLVTLDTNEAVVAEAVEKKCNLIIEHHPSIFHPVKKLDATLPLIKALSLAIKNGITVYSAHTNVDFCDGGLNDYVATQIGLINVRKIGDPCDPRMGELLKSLTLHEYAAKLRDIFNDTHVSTIGDKNKTITSVAVVNGGGGSSESDLLLSMQAGADVFVTGDVKYNVARLSKDANYAIIQVGHYDSEQGFLPLVADKIKKTFPYVEVYQATKLLNPYNSEV